MATRATARLSAPEIDQLPIIPSRLVTFGTLKEAVRRAVGGEVLATLVDDALYGDGPRPIYYRQLDDNARLVWSKAVRLYGEGSGMVYRDNGKRESVDYDTDTCWRAILDSLEGAPEGEKLSWFDLCRRVRGRGPTAVSRSFNRAGFVLEGVASERKLLGGPCPRCGTKVTAEEMDREALACLDCSGSMAEVGDVTLAG